MSPKQNKKATSSAIKGFPDYRVQGNKIIHVPTGNIFGTQSGSSWVQPDDEGGTIIASSPQALLASLASATNDHDKTHGFN